ncbi:unnamed protein product [Cladocopium goreaui]|uniref:Uncharacterized protein n=1 Tax=Cladocopium goreaui TaxID=2562237 RepID=A0A9P1DHZ5_9DINO|nr:unnamed protein product [Cladocopium goreaui]
MEGRPFVFEQRGGRCKLLEGDEFAVAARAKTMPRPWENKHANHPARLAKDWEELQIYLQKNNFKHVNEVKRRWFGLSWSYPLLKAAKEHDLWHMTLLLRFGANLWQKDSRGKTALDYIPLETLQWNMIREHENSQREQRPSASVIDDEAVVGEAARSKSENAEILTTDGGRP